MQSANRVSIAGSACLFILLGNLPTIASANENDSNLAWNPPEKSASQAYYFIPWSVAENVAPKQVAATTQQAQAAPPPQSQAEPEPQRAQSKPVIAETVPEARPQTTPPAPAQPANVTAVQRGKASYYGAKFHGRKTASGERFDQNKLTCAHGSLPFGCRLRVTNLRNNKSVEVKVNDRGAFHKHNRIIDLSKAAAKKIGMIRSGTADVKIEVLE